MERSIARGTGSTLVALALGAAIGSVIGVAHQDPDPNAGPSGALLVSWTLAMFAVPVLAPAAALLARAGPARAAALAFWSTFAFAIGIGLATPAMAFTPADFGLFRPMDWLGTIGRGVSGAAGFGALAAALAWTGARMRDRAGEIARAEAPRVEAAAPATPSEPAREPDPEALAVAKRRLAMGELTRHDYDELVRRLRE